MKTTARIAAHVGREQYLRWEGENGGFPLKWKRYREGGRPRHDGFQAKLPCGEWVCVLIPKKAK